MTEPVVFDPPKPTPRSFAEIEVEVLARALPGYEPRSQQTALAEFVEQTIGKRGKGLAQAGTGVGKSLGTLIPIAERAERTIVATATNALLNQYVRKDLPLLQEHMGLEWALLKGTRNYVCRAKLESANSMQVVNLTKLREELDGDKTHDGDKENVSTPIADREWGFLTTSSEDCPGKSKCPFAKECYVMAARQRAKDAKVVVTNQMMLLTDTVLKAQIGVSPLLGEYDTLVVDEAHELDEWTRKALTLEVNKVGLENLASEAAGFLANHGEDPGVTNRIHLAVGEVWDVLPKDGRMRLSFFVKHAEEFLDLIGALDATLAAVRDVEVERGDKQAQMTQYRIEGRLSSYSDRFATVATVDDHVYVRWTTQEQRTYQGRRQDVTVFHAAPVSVADWLAKNLWAGTTSVLVSATLKAGGDFAYVKEQLGLQQADSVDVGTSFDFTTQARLFIPSSDKPSPKARGMWQMYANETTLDMVEAAKGGALLLFTSRSAMQDAHQALSGRLRSRGYTVLMQGEATNRELADRFDQDTDSVLFALRSFMTGVSFEGETCRLVIIDKLPVPVPTEPVFEARSEMYGSQSFGKLSIPMMSLVLEQAFGRLIRTKRDRGVVAILDSRLASTGYGKQIVRSLPPAPLTHQLADIKEFFSKR